MKKIQVLFNDNKHKEIYGWLTSKADAEDRSMSATVIQAIKQAYTHEKQNSQIDVN